MRWAKDYFGRVAQATRPSPILPFFFPGVFLSKVKIPEKVDLPVGDFLLREFLSSFISTPLLWKAE